MGKSIKSARAKVKEMLLANEVHLRFENQFVCITLKSKKVIRGKLLSIDLGDNELVNNKKIIAFRLLENVNVKFIKKKEKEKQGILTSGLSVLIRISDVVKIERQDDELSSKGVSMN